MVTFEGHWQCPECSAFNEGAEPACTACGAPCDPDASGELADGAEAAQRTLIEDADAWAEPAPRAPLWRGLLATAMVVALLLSAALGFLALRTQEEAVTVAGFDWRRAIEVEACRMVPGEEWAEQAPTGARILWRARRVHHTERVQGEEREVYRDRVGYESERCLGARTERAEGTDQIPRWPLVRLLPGEREARRSASYVVLLKGRRVYLMELPKERWSSLREGETRSARIRSGRVVELS